MKLEPNAYRCLKCGKVVGPFSKRRMNTMDGKLCDECDGPLIPASVGVDRAADRSGHGNDNGVPPQGASGDFLKCATPTAALDR